MQTLLSGQHRSYWLSDPPRKTYPAAPATLKTDVLIIGGGLVGFSCAYFLQLAGKQVTVVEADRIGQGVSGHTTAQITSNHNLPYSELISQRGLDVARAYAQANQAAIETIEKIVTQEKIECDFQRVDDYLYAHDQESRTIIEHELEAAQTLGLPVELVEKVPVPFATAGAVKFSRQAQFHAYSYLQSLAEIVTSNGGQIFEQTRVHDVKGEAPLQVETETGILEATEVIVATQYPILDRGGYFSRMDAIRSYVLAAYLEDEIPVAFYEDTLDPFHYIRFQPTARGQLCMIGGEDHPTGTDSPEARYRQLEAFAKTHFKVKSIEYYWSSQDSYSHDRIPFIGHYLPGSEHLFLATAFGGYGMTHSTIAGQLISDMILKRPNQLSEIYSPQRLAFKTEVPNLVKQGAQVVKHLLQGKLPAEAQSAVENLPKGAAKIIDADREKLGVYRDEHDMLHTVSATCTHMGCTVAFNGAERSWDCPCHGSRFGVDGRVLHGPATRALSRKSGLETKSS